MNEIVIVAASAGDMIAKWDVVEPLLDKAMPVMLKRYLPIDLLAAMIAGAAQGWFIRTGEQLLAVMITKIDQYPRRRGLSVFAVSGPRMDEWFERAKEILTLYARQMGCDHFECQGRKGWERVLDLEPRSIFYVKDLTDDGGADL